MVDEPTPQGNVGREAADGNPTPPAPSNDPPANPGPSAEDKAKLEAAEKLVADNAAAKEAAATAEAAKKATDDVLDAAKQKTDAEAAAAAELEKDQTPLDLTTWGSTGHEGGDAVLGLLQNAGVTPEEAKTLLFDAVMAGDMSKVDNAALEKKIGKDKATLVMAGAKAFLNDRSAKNELIVKDIKDVAGGEENWSKVTSWAKAEGSGISEDQLGEYRDMIDNGGAQARFAASELVKAFNASGDNTTLTTPTTTPETVGDGGSPPSGRAMNRNEYAAAVAKAHKHGRLPAQSELDELSAARKRGRAQE